MKKLSIALLFGLLTMTSAYAAIPPDPGVIGIILRDKGAGQATPTIVYKLVHNTSKNAQTGTISIGSAVVYNTTSGDGIGVRMTTTSHDGAFAGIAVTLITADVTSAVTTASDAVGDSSWGWICVHGPANALASSGGTNGNAAGDTFITSSDAGAVTGWRSGVGETNAIVVANSVSGAGGFFQDAAGTASASTDPGAGAGNSGTVQVFVKAE